MQQNPLSLRTRFLSWMCLAMSASVLAAAPILPALHSDGKYNIPQSGKVSELRVSFTQVLKNSAPGLASEVVNIDGVATMEQLAIKIAALEAATKRTFSPLISIDGQPAKLTRKVVVSIPTAVSTQALAAKVGAVNAYRLPFSADLIVVEFKGATDALPGMEALAKVPGVVSASPSIASRIKTPQFVPNDIYYPLKVGAAGYCWHLKNTETPGLDINIEPAWDIVKGDGILIAVVDDGLEYLHEDLRANTNGAGGYDFVDTEINPTDGQHGTCVAGLIAARGNNKIGTTNGMVGGAMNGKMIGLRILADNPFDNATDEDTARALAWNNSFHVSNNSWGYSVAYYKIDVMDNAIISAVKLGRSGRGAIFMMSSGNGRGDALNSNLQPMHYLIQNNSIAAINDTAIYCSYSTPSAGLLCAAPSGELLNDPYRMITSTDRSGGLGYNPPRIPAVPGFNYPNKNYTNTFNGTSASCPIASGAVALICKAKSTLGWRDVQDIVIRTAQATGDSPLNFQFKTVDGITYHTSHNVGAGMIDAGAAVARAKTVKLLSAAYDNDYSTTIDAPIPDNSLAGVTRLLRVPNSPRVRCEKIQLTVETDHPNAASLIVTLTSPTGTVSRMQPRRPTFSRPASWTYVSTQHWGECSGGEWAVNVADVDAGQTGKLLQATVKIFGGGGPRPTEIPLITNDIVMPDGYENCQRYQEADPYYIVTTGCPLSYSASGLPKGMAVDFLTGRVYGKPTESGIFNVTLKAKNEIGTGTLDVTLTVLPQIPEPFMTGGFLGTATVGEPFRLQIFTNPTPFELLWTYDQGIPDGLLYSRLTGLITGTPTTAGIVRGIAQLSNYCGVSTHHFYIIIREASKSLGAALDVPGTQFNIDGNETDTWSWSNGGDGYGGDTARSPVIKIGARSNFSTVVTGPVDVAFDWSSSHASGDNTSFGVLPSPGTISEITGIVPWTHVTTSLGAGTHTLVWEYENNTLTLGGEEAARIDHLVLNYPELALALDVDPTGTVSSFGYDRWYRETTDTSDGVDAAISAPGLPDNGSSTMEISVTGPGTLSWQWKVSSLPGDILGVSLDWGDNLLEISDVAPPASVWSPASLVIPAGDHVVRWTYKKDDVAATPADPVVQDAGFVDSVIFTP